MYLYPFSVLRLLRFCNIEQQSIDLLYAAFYPLLPRYTIAKESHSPDKQFVAAYRRVSRSTSQLLVINKEEICPDCGSSLFH